MNVKHKKTSEIKEKVIRFRVTDNEHAEIMQQAKNKGYDTVSDYLRDLLKKDKTQSVDPPFNAIGEEMI